LAIRISRSPNPPVRPRRKRQPLGASVPGTGLLLLTGVVPDLFCGDTDAAHLARHQGFAWRPASGLPQRRCSNSAIALSPNEVLTPGRPCLRVHAQVRNDVILLSLLIMRVGRLAGAGCSPPPPTYGVSFPVHHDGHRRLPLSLRRGIAIVGRGLCARSALRRLNDRIMAAQDNLRDGERACRPVGAVSRRRERTLRRGLPVFSSLWFEHALASAVWRTARRYLLLPDSREASSKVS